MHIAGVHPWESWDFTWGEAVEVVNGYVLRENERARKRAVALYNAAVFLARTVSGSGEVQKFHEAFPGFGNPDEAAQGKEENGEMSDDAMFAVVRALNAQFGGREET